MKEVQGIECYSDRPKRKLYFCIKSQNSDKSNLLNCFVELLEKSYKGNLRLVDLFPWIT